MKRTINSSFLLFKIVLYLNSDNMSKVNEELIKYIGSLIIIILVIIFLSYLIVTNILQNQIKTVYQTDNLIVEINPNIKRNLNKLTDINGLNTPANIINITNSSSKLVNYKILLTGLTPDDSYLRLSINDTFIRSLSNFVKEDNSYILGEFAIPSNYSAFYNIRLWLNYSSSPYETNQYKFKLTIQEM